MHSSLFHLIPGQPYAFFANPADGSAAFPVPAGQGACERRTFLGYRTCDDTPCLEVARATGKTHLITLASVAHVRPVTLPD
jgi:hypothetical protein